MNTKNNLLFMFFCLISLAWVTSCQLEPVEESADVEFSELGGESADELEMLDSKMGDDDMREIASMGEEEPFEEEPFEEEGIEHEEAEKFEESLAEAKDPEEEMDSDEDFLDEENEDEDLDELMALREESEKKKAMKVVKKEKLGKIIITNNALIKAAKIGTPETIRYLLSTGIDINYKNDKGVTALHTAAVNKRWENVKALIKLGANKKVSNARGQTPREVAELTKHKLTIRAFDTDPMRSISSDE